MISSHTINSKNIFANKGERKKIVNAAAEYRAVIFFREGAKTENTLCKTIFRRSVLWLMGSS